MKRRIISFDSSSALAAVKIFMSCYKRGIKDAEYISDKYMCDDFKKKVRVPGVYGRVTDDYTVSESDWIVYLLFANGTRPAPPPQANLINGINKRSKMACLFRVAQEFYILGLDDYNECPSIHEFSLLDKTNMIRWTPKGLVKITKSEVVSEVQRMCILRSRIDSESEDYDSCLFKIDYEKFAMDLWLNLIGYKTQLFE